MLTVLAVGASALMALPTIMAATCPIELDMDLSRYKGVARPWTKADAKIDFADQQFVYGKGYERTLVGNNELMVMCPKGVH